MQNKRAYTDDDGDQVIDCSKCGDKYFVDKVNIDPVVCYWYCENCTLDNSDAA